MSHTDSDPSRRRSDRSHTHGDHEDPVRHSLRLLFLRHAESHNNQVYRNARYIYRGGTPNFDSQGWNDYVDRHRSADPGLSEVGREQAQHLAAYLVPHLHPHGASVICSPMRRTLETIRPTLQGLRTTQAAVRLLIHAEYFESEGCHTRNRAEPGMSPQEIRALCQQPLDPASHEERPTDPALSHDAHAEHEWLTFHGFSGKDQGWYANRTAAETRAESERRAAKFYLWLLEHLDQQLVRHVQDSCGGTNNASSREAKDKLDAPPQHGPAHPTTLLVGHGDFMSLVLKRIVAGFGHAVETEGIPHRSAFVHFNTGITELEYFGKGRFLLMGQNHTPHFSPTDCERLRTGGSLKDGWSYLMPNDKFLLDAEVSVAFEDELEDHVVEQATALKALYLSSEAADNFRADSIHLSVERQDEPETVENRDCVKHFIVKRGLQVVGVASYSESTARLFDVAVRPSAGPQVSETLFDAVKQYAKQSGRSGSLLVTPRSRESRTLFESMGFVEVKDDSSPNQMELKH